ncbi:hypothetical protein [Sphingosinicella sp. BN140058]|uniref:hypothetical protein n=1 Tax=Sphingosinicella sp. BN140058 TaxID=1892855 RepID=UPI001010B686|nr:hypothetical protein [Sphingosinicella sp. BN140058]QAY80365.1 hypothetical protein ETR14_27375 [Sphingosinicella sp. BN140058]
MLTISNLVAATLDKTKASPELAAKMALIREARRTGTPGLAELALEAVRMKAIELEESSNAGLLLFSAAHLVNADLN